MLVKIVLCYSVIVATLTLPQPQVDLTGIKCVVQGERSAIQTATVGYKNGRIYLCSDHCAEAFKQDVELAADARFAVKANHQLVLTGQYVQKVCPISGKAVDEIHNLTIAAVEIGFGCAQCRAKVSELETIEEKVALLFSDEAFEKAFVPKPVEASLAYTQSNSAPKPKGGSNVSRKEEKVSQLVAERPVEKTSEKK